MKSVCLSVACAQGPAICGQLAIDQSFLHQLAIAPGEREVDTLRAAILEYTRFILSLASGMYNSAYLFTFEIIPVSWPQ